MDLITIATDMGILELARPWYKYNDKSVAQGKDKLYDVLFNDRAMFDEILDKIFFLFGIRAPEYSKVVDEYLNPGYGTVLEEDINQETGEIAVENE